MRVEEREQLIQKYREVARKKKFKFDFISLFLIIFLLILLLSMIIIGLPNDLKAKELNDMRLTSINNVTIGERVKIYGNIESEQEIPISGYNSGDRFKGEVHNFYINDTTGRIYVDFFGDLNKPKFTIYGAPHVNEKNKEYHNNDYACIIGKTSNENSTNTIYLVYISDSPAGFYQARLDFLNYLSLLFSIGVIIFIMVLLLLFNHEYYNISTKWNKNIFSMTNVLRVISFIVFILFLNPFIYYLLVQENIYYYSSILTFSFFVSVLIFSQILSLSDEGHHQLRRFVHFKHEKFEQYYEIGNMIEAILDIVGFKHTKFDRNALGLKLVDYAMAIKLYHPTHKMMGIKLGIKPVKNESQVRVFEVLKKKFDEEFDKDKWLE